MIDIIIIALLCGTLIYAYTLSRRISKLRDVLIEVGPALMAFSEAVDRTEETVSDMKAISTNISARGRAPMATPTTDRKPSKTEMINSFFGSGKRRQV